jgi:hypothetical protein
MVSTHQIEMVVMTAGEPASDQVIVKPFAPATLQSHAPIDLHNVEEHACHHDGEIDQRQKQHAACVVRLQSVEQCAIP